MHSGTKRLQNDPIGIGYFIFPSFLRVIVRRTAGNTGHQVFYCDPDLGGVDDKIK